MTPDNFPPHVPKVVLTGGPCAGKTTALAYLTEKFTQLGFRVFTVPEAATLSFGTGVDLPTMVESGAAPQFQRRLMELQMALEDTVVEYARLHPSPSVVICDRGVLDNAAYMPDGAFADLCFELGTSPARLRERYDAVFALVTAADGAEEHYNLDNSARTESPVLARELDARTRRAWAGHEHLTVVPNVRNTPDGPVPVSFSDKLRHLYRAVAGFLGVPAPTEIERKFLLRPGAADAVRASDLGPVASDITQMYLVPDGAGSERRIRARRPSGCPPVSLESVFVYTEKRDVSPLVRHELSRPLSLAEYRDLERQADPDLSPVHKTRLNFVWGNDYFHLDVFAGGPSHELLEVELTDPDAHVVLPPLLEPFVVAEVTDDPAWRNSAVAARLSSRSYAA